MLYLLYRLRSRRILPAAFPRFFKRLFSRLTGGVRTSPKVQQSLDDGAPANPVATAYALLAELAEPDHSTIAGINPFASSGGFALYAAVESFVTFFFLWLALTVARRIFHLDFLLLPAFWCVLIGALLAYIFLGISTFTTTLQTSKEGLDRLLAPLRPTVKFYNRRASAQWRFLEASRQVDRQALHLATKMLTTSRAFAERRAKYFLGEIVSKVGVLPGMIALLFGAGKTVKIDLPEWAVANENGLLITAYVWLFLSFVAVMDNVLIATYDRLIAAFDVASSIDSPSGDPPEDRDPPNPLSTAD